MKQDNAGVPGFVKGDVIDNLEIVDLSVDGTGIARHQGRVIFLDKGLPNDIVRAKVEGLKKNIARARIVDVISPSVHAVSPICPHADACGACALQRLAYSRILDWKSNYIKQCLKHIGKVENLEMAEIEASPAKRAWRNKVSYAFASAWAQSDPGGHEQKMTLLGLRGRAGHTVIETTDCVAQDPCVMPMLDYVRQEVRRLEIPAWNPIAHPDKGAPENRISGRQNRGYLRRLVAHSPEYAPAGKRQILIEIITGPDHFLCDEEHAYTGKDRGGRGTGGARADANKLNRLERLHLLAQELMERFDLSGFVHTERRDATDIAYGERKVQVLGSETCFERFGPLLVKVPYNVFLQTNSGAARRLYEIIAAEASLQSSDIVWDLYSGAGCMGLYLAKSVQAVHGVDIAPEAVACARENAGTLGLDNCFFYAGEPDPDLSHKLPPPDLIIVDPPRAGLSEKAAELLRCLPARRLLYVSCDAATQARDVLRLSEGWQAIKGLPLDMFPYSPHVENILVFAKKVF
ncbi:MAG: class I SAM-dependent RNA methyltransferase [Desulfovibrio sp.]|jgi:23S rRNA (uracil1939-C5)-methyltransferase|nr:class I SAM-dependent RNA methyltransferase [Desulfovibrio sp.]